ncbi:hypothetical protein [Streptomyces sp. NPDC127039]|uniref:sodium:solute symporter family transporter n=1 Tax=Streptomyces sp. NPDC127039 TaxID=3347115 RepID=UPI003665BE0D
MVVSLCFFLCLMLGIDNDRISGFFVADRSLSSVRNSLALCGDFMPTAALLSPVGLVALSGYDGMLLAMSAVAALGVLLTMAEPLRNTGQFTLGGVLESRMAGNTIRVSGAIITVIVCVPLTVAQLTVAGEATSYLLDLDKPGAGRLCTALIGLLIISFAAFGGMRGTSVMQICKVVVAFGTVLALTAAVAAHFDWDLGAMMGEAARQSGRAEAFYAPGQLFVDSATGPLELVSVCLTVALGSVVAPPVLMRISASRSGRTARRSSTYAIVMITLFHGFVVLLGLGAGAVVGGQAIVADDPQGNSTLFLLVGKLAEGPGGSALITMVACAVFVIALGAVAGLMLAIAASLSHDIYPLLRRGGRVTGQREVTAARWAVVALGLISVLLAVWLSGCLAVPLEHPAHRFVRRRRGSVGDPARSRLQPLLEGVHPDRPVVDPLRFAVVLRRAAVLQPRRLGQPLLPPPGPGLPLVPASGRRGGLRSLGVPARLAGQPPQRTEPGRPRPVRRDGGQGAHRYRGRVTRCAAQRASRRTHQWSVACCAGAQPPLRAR